MGYETELIIGKPYSVDPLPIVLDVCTIKLGKCGYYSATSSLLAKWRGLGKAHAMYHHGDGDTLVTEDKYAAPLTSVPMKDLLAAMIADQQNDGEHRRFALAIAMLTELTGPNWGSEWTHDDDLVCIQYGY